MIFRLYKTFSLIIKAIFRFLERVTIIIFKADLFLLEFFGRKYTYVFFLFANFFGNFNDSENLSTVLVLFRFFCFCLSWYLALTSILVYIVFNIPLTKEYFYKLLGRDFVISKIGNPGSIPLGKFAAPVIMALAVNEGGKYGHTAQNDALAETTLQTQTDAITQNPHLDVQQKSEYTRRALDNHSERSNRTIKGPLVELMKW